ncbi:MMPL family transporter [bacterium]|nr:MMPL family transporter [bacterium]
MVRQIKIFKYLLLILFFIILLILSIIPRGNVETNLVRTILPQSVISSTDIVPLANKASSVLRIIFESDDEENLENAKNNFIQYTDKDYFTVNNSDISEVFEKYMSAPENFLSSEIRQKLIQKKYDEVYKDAIERLYNPAEIQLTTFDKDPYLILNEFIISNKRDINTENIIDGKYYDYITLKIKSNEGLSPELSNKKVKEIVDLQHKLSDSSVKIYLSGSPIHSYYTSKQSVKDINIICFLSVLLILGLTYRYFKNIKLIFPIAMSIIIGLLTGFAATKLWFENFQVMTMVFSATLIGIGIDYSYHYFFSDKIDKTFVKNLTFSLLTTIIPFILLYFTGIELLQQVSVFTVFGLLAIYLVVIIFYRDFGKYTPVRTINPNKKLYISLMAILFISAIFGYFILNFNDSLSSLYSPDKKLIKAEKLYNILSGSNDIKTQMVTVRGNNINEILETEERISDKLDKENIKSFSLSRLFPSEKRQEENFMLVKALYKNNLNKYSSILSQKQISYLLNKEFNVVPFDENFPLCEFLLNNNTSVMMVFSDKKLNLEEEYAAIVDIQTEIGNYLKAYRILLLKIMPVVIIVLFILLSVIYGIKRSVRIIIPPVSGILLAVGITCLINGEINLFEIIACYLVLGFTMDYSIFRTNKGERTEDAILISSVTTMFSFLLLSLCGFKLLSSIAMILFFGILISYLSGYLLFNRKEEEQR